MADAAPPPPPDAPPPDVPPPGAPRPEASNPEAPQPKPPISFEEFAKVDLRIARVIQCENHPAADRLLKLQVDDGSGRPRQICAGIRGAYTAEELVGKTIVIVANLSPRVIRGEESRGMLLAASDAPGAGERRIVVLTTMSEMPPGAIVS